MFRSVSIRGWKELLIALGFVEEDGSFILKEPDTKLIMYANTQLNMCADLRRGQTIVLIMSLCIFSFNSADALGHTAIEADEHTHALSLVNLDNLSRCLIVADFCF
jgi:hypothetical protein